MFSGCDHACESLENSTVTVLPYVAERAKGFRPLQADNFAAPVRRQQKILSKELEHIDFKRFEGWPRLEQQPLAMSRRHVSP